MTAIYPLFSLRDGILRRGYGNIWLDWVFYGHLIRGYFSVDAGPKTDVDRSASQISIKDEASVDILTGLSVILKF